MNDIKAIINFVQMYFLKDMLLFSKTALLCENTQIPEKPNAADIIAKESGCAISCSETNLIPVVISKKQRITEMNNGVDCANTFFIKLEITEKIII